MENEKFIIDSRLMTRIKSNLDNNCYDQSGESIGLLSSNYGYNNSDYVCYDSNSTIFNQYFNHSDLLKEAFNIISDISYLDDGIIDFINKLYMAGIVTEEDVRDKYGRTDIIKIQV